ncbi:hypothetical protein CFOL_v3_19742, partial [Cephalotus follicularis]
DAVNTLILTIFKHFVGDMSAITDRNNELLLNLKCRSMSKFQRYKDTFLVKVIYRHNCNSNVGLELCNNLKLKKQIKREKLTSKKELGQFCG